MMTTRMLRSLFATCVVPLLIVQAACVCLPRPAHAADRDPRPNIVFMLADDQGWNGLSVEMAPDVPGSRSEIYQTPNL
ncbi:MAG: hypothetical protein ACKOHG_15415 [Planctomycetia bacterium]